MNQTSSGVDRRVRGLPFSAAVSAFTSNTSAASFRGSSSVGKRSKSSTTSSTSRKTSLTTTVIVSPTACVAPTRKDLLASTGSGPLSSRRPQTMARRVRAHWPPAQLCRRPARRRADVAQLVVQRLVRHALHSLRLPPLNRVQADRRGPADCANGRCARALSSTELPVAKGAAGGAVLGLEVVDQQAPHPAPRPACRSAPRSSRR